MDQNSFDSFDEMAERTIWPWIDDESQESDDICNECWEQVDDDYDDSMDGDHDSAMESAGFGTDEDYGRFGDEEY